MSLPLPWVDQIFLKLALVYGRDFIGRWEGLEIADVKADWSHELAGLENWREAIAHALATLPPGKPPTVLEFRELARKAPQRAREALPGPPVNQKRANAELAKARELTGGRRLSSGNGGNKAWARRVIERHNAGELLSPFTLRSAAEAIKHEVGN